MPRCVVIASPAISAASVLAPDLFSNVRKGTLARVKRTAACFEILHAQQLQERFHLSLMISTNIDRNEDKPKLESQVTSNEIMH